MEIAGGAVFQTGTLVDSDHLGISAAQLDRKIAVSRQFDRPVETGLCLCQISAEIVSGQFVEGRQLGLIPPVLLYDLQQAVIGAGLTQGKLDKGLQYYRQQIAKALHNSLFS